MKVGNAVRLIRKNKNLNQTDFAEYVGISQTYLSQIETNQRNPNISILEKIGEKLGIPVPVIMFLSLEEGDVPPGKRDIYNNLNPVMKDFINKVFI